MTVIRPGYLFNDNEIIVPHKRDIIFRPPVVEKVTTGKMTVI